MAERPRHPAGASVVNVVLGTAGHIDHGKTALVRRLTGIDADRFPEEKARGMTIDIGYAHMLLDSRLSLGIIDVPGHERFVRNMVAGATGFGLVLLVVAADDGVMPQTREHVEIMEMLGLRRGLVAVTKTDLVDRELLELVEEDVRDFLEGTFLGDAPLFLVSSHTGEGIDELRRAIEEAMAGLAAPSGEGVFRLPVQRSFSARGQGTVVTGVAVSGTLDVGDRVEIQPLGLEARVKAMEAYGASLPTARAGHRTALNLVGVDYRALHRGHVVVEPGFLRPADRVTARCRLLASARKPLRNQASVRFHAGTFEVLGRLSLLERRILRPGEEDWVQIRLDGPAPVAPGDRFLLRRPSPAATIGGGLILETSGRKLKPRRSWTLARLAALEEALPDPRRLVLHHLRQAGLEPLSPEELGRSAFLPVERVRAILDASAGDVVPVFRGEKFLDRDAFRAALARILARLEEHHRLHPLRFGASKVALRRDLDLDRRLFDTLIAVLEEEGRVRLRPDGLLALASFAPDPCEEDLAALEALSDAFGEAGFSPPEPGEALAALPPRPAPGEELLAHLREKGVLVEVAPGLLFHSGALAEAEEILRREIPARGGLEAADFRDLVGTTRKYAIPLLEHFDARGLTMRLDNVRVLREHGGTSPASQSSP